MSELRQALLDFADARDRDVGFPTGLTDTMRSAASRIAELERIAEGSHEKRLRSDHARLLAERELDEARQRTETLRVDFDRINDDLRERVAVLEAALREIAYLHDGEEFTDAADASERRMDIARAALAGRGGAEPDERFPFHVEGCICPRFNDVAPNLIADLTCPVHGVNGTDPGDKLAERGVS